MYDDQSYQALVEELALRHCVLFVGAGLSIGAGLPGWYDLLIGLDRRLGTQIGPPRGDFLDYAEKLEQLKGRLCLVEALREIMDGPGIRPSAVHRSLLALPFHAIFTTNYDGLIERTLEGLGKRYDSIRYDEEVGVIDEHEAMPVIKFHGDLEDPPGIVLTRTDYTLYPMKHPAFTPLFEAMLATRTFLFVGFGLTDDNFQELDKTVQRALGRYRRKAYAVMVQNDPTRSLTMPHYEILGVPVSEIDVFLRNLAGDVQSLIGKTFPTQGDLKQKAWAAMNQSLRRLPRDLFAFADKGPGRPPKDRVAIRYRRQIYHLLFEMEGFQIQDATAWRKLGMALFKMRDYRAALRAYSRSSVHDVQAARIIARCHWYLEEKWRTRRILENLVYPPHLGGEVDLAYLEAWPGDVAFFAHTCNWEASEHLERRRYHRALFLARRALTALEAWLEKHPGLPRNYRWIWKYIHNHIGRSHLLLIQAGEPHDDHYSKAQQALEMAIEVSNQSFSEAWSNLLDLYKDIGDRTAAEDLKQRILASRKRKVIQQLKAWHPRESWERIKPVRGPAVTAPN